MKLHIIEKTIDINEVFIVSENSDDIQCPIAVFDNEESAKQYVKKYNKELIERLKKSYGKSWKLHQSDNDYELCYEKFDVLSRLEE